MYTVINNGKIKAVKVYRKLKEKLDRLIDKLRKKDKNSKNCLEGYLTQSCRNCEFWRNDETACGCACPFPIMHCEAFAKMCNETENDIRREDGKNG